MGIIKEQFTLSMLLFHLFMCNPIYEHFWRSQTELKHCANGENPVLKIDFDLSYAKDFNNTEKNDWIQTRIGALEDVFRMCPILEDIFGNSKTLTQVSEKLFIPTISWILESAIR